MKPNQKNRYNGRYNNRNNRSMILRNTALESSGPSGKLHGTALQLFEKYQAAAKDALIQNDLILAQTYLQYADHYIRLQNIAIANEQMLRGSVPQNNTASSGTLLEEEKTEIEPETEAEPEETVLEEEKSSEEVLDSKAEAIKEEKKESSAHKTNAKETVKMIRKVKKENNENLEQANANEQKAPIIVQKVVRKSHPRPKSEKPENIISMPEEF